MGPVALAALLALAQSAPSVPAAPSTPSVTIAPPGSTVADFVLEAADGRRLSLMEEVPGRTLTVVAFTSVGCPITKLLAPRLGRCEKEYRERGVRFLGVDPNIQDSAAE